LSNKIKIWLSSSKQLELRKPSQMRRKNEYQRKVLKSLNRQLKHRLKLTRLMLSLWNQSHLSNKQRRQSIKSMLHPSQKLRALPNHLTFASWSWNALCFTLN
jgi:hypothetical protein